MSQTNPPVQSEYMHCDNCGHARVHGYDHCTDCGTKFAVRDFSMRAFWIATIVNVVVYLVTHYTIFCFFSSPLAYLGYVAYKKNEYGEKWETKEVLSAILAIPFALWGAVLLNMVF